MLLKITVTESTRDRIGFIKFLRELTGSGLKEAKDASDTLYTPDIGIRPGVFIGRADSARVAMYLIARAGHRLPFGVQLQALEDIGTVWPLGGPQ